MPVIAISEIKSRQFIPPPKEDGGILAVFSQKSSNPLDFTAHFE
jgi:hypothetical protein